MSEELVIRQCAPTLAGIKTGNLFSCRYETVEEIRMFIRRLNQVLVSKGLRVLPLRCSERRALIYIYRPARLKKDLKDQMACELLRTRGYSSENPERCVARLASRLQADTEFPHEIGLFLGYPPEDVYGFITNQAECSKCIGCWKVYGDVQKARRLFETYKKCTVVYQRQWSNGKTIEQLAVAI